MTPEALVARAMLSAVKRKGGIAQSDISYYAIPPDYLVEFIEPKSDRAKYGVKPIFVAFGEDNARTIIDNMASYDWASFCEVNQWQLKMA